MRVEPYKIETLAEADQYLHDLFKDDVYRSMEIVRERAAKYISDKSIEEYFLRRASEILIG